VKVFRSSDDNDNYAENSRLKRCLNKKLNSKTISCIALIAGVVAGVLVTHSVFAKSFSENSNIVISGSGGKNNIASTIIKSVTSDRISAASIDKKLTGKIATSKFDLSNGKVQIIFFGDWILDAKGKDGIKFASILTMKNLDDGSESKYNIANLKVTSYQVINGEYRLEGKLDITRVGSSPKSWGNIPVVISIPQDEKIIMINFEDTILPLLGVVTSNT
jgi:hypothetical protein